MSLKIIFRKSHFICYNKDERKGEKDIYSGRENPFLSASVLNSFLKLSVTGNKMPVGSFQSNSLIDYPQTVSSLIFFNSCNFKCPYCFNSGLIESKHIISQNEIIQKLKKNKHFISDVVIVGGEPTINHDLSFYCKTIKSLGFNIKLDTNGSKPEVIARLLNENLIDYLCMDIKCKLRDYKLFSEASEQTIKTSINLIKKSKLPHHFRTTTYKKFISDDFLKETKDLIGDSKYILQECLTGDFCFSTVKKDDVLTKKELSEIIKKSKAFGFNIDNTVF